MFRGTEKAHYVGCTLQDLDLPEGILCYRRKDCDPAQADSES